MMKISLFNFILCLATLFVLPATAQRPPTLEYVRELIAAKNTTDAVAILKGDSSHLLKTEKDYRDVSQWLSIFLYETSMETYEKAEDLSTNDFSGAKEQFEALLEKEPHNKVVLSSYLSFLIDKQKWSDAKSLAEKSISQFPYFTVFSVYKWWISLGQGEAAGPVTCDKKIMLPVEQELCHLAHLIAKVQGKDTKKKPTEQELKNLAGKTTIPDAFYWLWKGTNNEAYLKRYVSLCRGLTEKYKKNYRIVPGLCAKMLESESQLEPKQNDEPNAN